MKDRALNLIGERFGRLLVIERDHKKRPGKHNAWWVCKCDCGKVTRRAGSELRFRARIGMLQSCGCFGARRSVIDLHGQRFGFLTVAGRDPDKHRAFWLCQCDCGRTISREGTDLRKYAKEGKKQSCGCRTGVNKDEMRKQGACTSCLLRFPSPGFKRCDRCRAVSNRSLKKHRIKAAALGLCISCRWRIPRDGIRHCDHCLDRPKRNASWCDECLSNGHRHGCSALSTA